MIRRRYKNREGYEIGQNVRWKSRRSVDQWDRSGTVVDVLPTRVCVRYLMSLQVGRTVVEEAGYNERWFDNDEVVATPTFLLPTDTEA